jgi:MoxR-like ATPase
VIEDSTRDAIERLLNGLELVIRGKRDFLKLALTGLFAGGHILLEDMPGLGKTTVAKTIAKLVGGTAPLSEDLLACRELVFKRIQFTPDLLPYDITGVDVFNPKTQEFNFVPGPVLANIVLADEINRTTPKVQSALLEVMEERQVTIGSNSHRPPEPFFVIATQNPIESEGTFPLPAAQLDRFIMKLSLGYPEKADEIAILSENPAQDVLNSLKPVVTLAEFLQIQKTAAEIYCNNEIKSAIVDIVRQTRSNNAFSLGASPRAALHFLHTAKAYAMIAGRNFVSDGDLCALAACVLCHRVKLRDTKADCAKIINEICLSRCDEGQIHG